MFDIYITRIHVLPACKYLTHELGRPEFFFFRESLIWSRNCSYMERQILVLCSSRKTAAGTYPAPHSHMQFLKIPHFSSHVVLLWLKSLHGILQIWRLIWH